MHFNTQVFNPKWYVEQFKGWTKTSYTLLAFGYVVILLTNLHNPNYGITIAGLIGFTTTLAITNAKPINGILGFISAILYIYYALKAGNPADALLQGFYVFALDLPVLLSSEWAKDVHKKVRFIREVNNRGEKHSSKYWYTILAVTMIGSFVAAYLFETQILHTARPITDSLVLASGMSGAILTTLRFSESWYFWIFQGLFQVALWGLTAIHGDANYVLFVTYLMYVSNDLIGIFQSKWFHHKEEAKEIESAARIAAVQSNN